MISIGKTLSAFFAWWGSELRACIPPQVIGRIRPVRRLSLLWLGPQVLLRWTAGRETRELGRISTDAPAVEAGAELAAIVATVPYKQAEIVLELPPEQILRREIELPVAAAENLREVLGFELDRLTPFKADDAVFDYRIEKIDRAAKRMTVSLVVAPRVSILRMLSFTEGLGLSADRVTVSASTEMPEARRPFDLRPGEQLSRSVGWARRLTGSLAVAATVLVVLAVWLPLQRKQEILAVYEERLTELRPQAAEAADLRQQIRAKAAQASFIVRHRMERPLAVTVLKEITERLADDAWLVQFRLSGQTLTISGYAQAATSLVPALEDSPLLTDVKFSAPVTPDVTISRDRFGIVAEVARQ